MYIGMCMNEVKKTTTIKNSNQKQNIFSFKLVLVFETSAVFMFIKTLRNSDMNLEMIVVNSSILLFLFKTILC